MDEILVEKKPWARLFKKRAIRRKVGNQPQQKVLFHGEEREFFGKEFHFGFHVICEFCKYILAFLFQIFVVISSILVVILSSASMSLVKTRDSS